MKKMFNSKKLQHYSKNNIGNISLVIACSGFLILEILHKFWGIDGFFFRLLITGFEASTVGAFADWFAVSALYQKIPVPIIGRHTNIILKNREKLENGIVNVVLNEWLSKQALEETLKKTNLVSIIGNLISKGNKEIFIKEIKSYEENIKKELVKIIISCLKMQLYKKEFKEYLIQVINKILEEGHTSKKFLIDIGKRLNIINTEKISEKILNVLINEFNKAENDMSFFQVILKDVIEEIFKKFPEFLESGYKALQEDDLQREKLNQLLREFLMPLIDDLQPKIGETVRSSLKKLSDEELVIFIKQKIDYDLQYIRLNGAVVGGIVGIILALIKEMFHLI